MVKKYRVHDHIRFHHVLSDKECAEVDAKTWDRHVVGSCEDVFWTAFNEFLESRGYKFISMDQDMDEHDGPCWSFVERRQTYDEGPNFECDWL